MQSPGVGPMVVPFVLSGQMLSAALLNRTSLRGLYLAGQSVLAPGVLGTILGSLATVQFIVGPERFRSEVRV